MQPEMATYWLWPVWAISWLAAALWSDRAAARPGFLAEAPYRVVTFIGGYLLFAFASAHGTARWQAQSLHRLGGLASPVWSVPVALGWALFALTLVGFAVCWWARLYLGRLWSGNITRKAAHHIVDTGPYRLVRHPIYTGILISALAMAVLKGTPAAVVGLAIFWAGFHIKARLEERFLREGLGAEAYDAYSRRTPMLIPLPRRRR